MHGRSSIVGHLRGIPTMKITWAVFVLLIQTLQCLASDDSPFQLTNKDTGFCLVKRHDYCFEGRWTTGDRLLYMWLDKCLGVQGKSVGSEVSLYDCDENSEFQKWECKNGTALALKGQDLYIEITADNTAVLSKTIGPKSHFIITGTSQGACSRTHRELYTIGGNANGRPCMFPFYYKNNWYSHCTETDNAEGRQWCAVQTKYDHELWGLCPTNVKTDWNKNPVTGEYYQLNTESSLTWHQAEASCKQQVASLLSITDPHQKAYISALLVARGRGQGDKLWTGMVQNPEHGWQWSNGRPYRYLNWDSGHPLSNPGYDCAIINGDVQFSWQSSPCTKKLGYICYNEGATTVPTTAANTGFCSRPWIPYNGHCFHLHRTPLKTWSDAHKECRKEGGDLVSIRNVEDQSFVISELGFASIDELWIGLNDKKTEGLFDWSDHSTVSFTSWESGKPSISSDKEDCVLMRGKNGNWADRECDEKHGFICMKPSLSDPPGDEVEQNAGCKAGWKKHGSYCYFVGTQTKTFDEAKDDCKNSDSYLADVSNGVDNAFLVSLVGLRPEKYFWLGLSNQKNIDHFLWTNTDTVRFTHWNAQMPGHEQGCVAMTTGVFAGLWDVLPCTNKEKYICKHQVEGAPLTTTPPTVAPPKCADGWDQIGTRHSCYKFFPDSSTKKRTWYEAKDYCRAIGGDLLSIHSNAELHIKRRYETAWIGLSAPDPVTGYTWSDGSPVNFQHWQQGEPNNYNNAESCAEFNIGMQQWSGSWNDAQCERYNGWLCQIRAGTTPKPPPAPVAPDYNTTSDGWLVWNGTQYYINKKSMAMEEARSFCQQKHSDLVTIHSEAESVFLWKQVSTSYSNYWIGLTVYLDGTFEWMDGSPVFFQKWNKDQPDFRNYDENCAAMASYTGFWHDFNCGREYKSICKRSVSPPANTTVAPTQAPIGGCLSPWKKFNSKCYNIITGQKLRWEDGRTHCQAMNGNLVSIPSRHVEVFLMSQMVDTPTEDLWIGFHNSYSDGYYWTDGRPRLYNHLDLRNSRRSYYDHMDFFFHMQYLRAQREPLCAVINTNPSLGIGKWIPKSCNDTNGFICLRNVDPYLTASSEPTISSEYFKILNDSIKVNNQQMDWEAAKKHCEDDGANLASLRNEWSQAYVELLAGNLKAPLWIGLNKMQTNGYFKYVDGWQLRFAKWDRYEPSKNKSCVYVDVNGKWKTADCKQTMKSVCMKSEDVPPVEPSDFPGVCPENPDSFNRGQNFWYPFKGHCYMFLTESRRWADASTSCVQHGGSLASIEDPFEQNFIQSHVKTFEDSHDSFWVGLFQTHKGEWSWLDKTVMDYTNWAQGQPDGRSYGGISSEDGTWSAASSWYYRGYICKTPKVIPPVPSASPAKVGLARSRIALAVGLVITGLAIGTFISIFLFKKRAQRLPIPDKITNFENPLFVSNKPSQPDVVDTSNLVENAEEKSPEPIVTV